MWSVLIGRHPHPLLHPNYPAWSREGEREGEGVKVKKTVPKKVSGVIREGRDRGSGVRTY